MRWMGTQVKCALHVGGERCLYKLYQRNEGQINVFQSLLLEKTGRQKKQEWPGVRCANTRLRSLPSTRRVPDAPAPPRLTPGPARPAPPLRGVCSPNTKYYWMMIRHLRVSRRCPSNRHRPRSRRRLAAQPDTRENPHYFIIMLFVLFHFITYGFV